MATEEPRAQPETLTAHAEELTIDRVERVVGSLRARKRVETDVVEQLIPRAVEDCDVERIDADANDSGEVVTLPDGSISVPLLEEELVITKRTVVRERIVIRKRVETRQEQVSDYVRRERIELEADPGVVVDHDDESR